MSSSLQNFVVLSPIFSFPLGTSYMPKAIHKSIAVGEMTRLLRNTSSPTIFTAYKKKLLKCFGRREESNQCNTI